MIEKNIYKNLKPKAKLILCGNEKVYGPGLNDLLHLIGAKKSAQAACKEMSMSYAKAWKIIRRLENELGIKIIETKTGGAKGGVSMLTTEAKNLVKKFDLMQKDLEKYTQKIYKEYFG